MADRNRNQWEERTQNQRWESRDNRSQFDRSRDDYSSNYGNNGESRYGGTGFRSDYEGERPYGNEHSSSNYGDTSSRRDFTDDYSDFERARDRSVNVGSGYDPYHYGQTVGSFNQGKEGSYSSRLDYRRDPDNYNRTSFDRDSGYDSDYNRSYGRRDSGNYGGGAYYGNNNRDRERRSDWNNRDRNRDTRNADRDWWDRATDEVSSWFGDDEAERRRERDRAMGPHRGKGPKGYQRSDERIKDDVNDRLSDDSFIDASDIDVTVENNEVVLTGTVDTKEEKRRAEDIAERISGIKNVENRLKVKNRSTTGATIYKDRD
jgi:osmotically-inducible protein OsmY